jgi:hypothetical protein
LTDEWTAGNRNSRQVRILRGRMSVWQAYVSISGSLITKKRLVINSRAHQDYWTPASTNERTDEMKDSNRLKICIVAYPERSMRDSKFGRPNREQSIDWLRPGAHAPPNTRIASNCTRRSPPPILVMTRSPTHRAAKRLVAIGPLVR